MAVTRNLITATALTCFLSIPVRAADFECEQFEGTVLLQADEQCKILDIRARHKQFPDVTFLAELAGADNTCFIGEISASWLGDEPVTGKSISGQTVHEFSLPGLLTAATALRLRDDDGDPIGTLFLRDTIFLDLDSLEAQEELVVIAGTRVFRGAKGTIRITGTEFVPPGAAASGTICIED